MKHTQYKRPAYACGDGETCPHEIKGAHGYHNEEWSYAVVADDGCAALQLNVGSGIYTADTPPFYSRDDEKPEAYSLDLHVNFPCDRNDVKYGQPATPCDFVKGGKCHTPYSATLAAIDFFAAHFVRADGYEQPASFWVALEDRLLLIRPEYIDASTVWVKCIHCDTLGTVRRDLPA